MRDHVHRFTVLLAGAVAVAIGGGLAGGCGSKHKSSDPVPQALQTQGEANRAMLELAFTRQVRNGIVEERALYPYHFRPGSAELNELGERQVEVIARGYRGGDVRVAMIRGEAVEAELFDARTEQVRQRFADAGMAAERVTLAESLSGGRGITASQIELMLAEDEDLAAAAGTSSAATGTGGR